MFEIQVCNLGLGFESVNVVNEFIQMKPLQRYTWSRIFFFVSGYIWDLRFDVGCSKIEVNSLTPEFRKFKIQILFSCFLLRLYCSSEVNLSRVTITID